MKKAFDANVSRTRPKLRLGAALAAPGDEAPAPPVAPVEPDVAAAVAAVQNELAAQVRSRVETGKAPKPSATAALAVALEQPAAAASHVGAEVLRPPPTAQLESVADEATSKSYAGAQVLSAAPAAALDAPDLEESRGGPGRPTARTPQKATPPEPLTQVQTPKESLSDRRARLKERLAAVRENPRPEPLPATVAEAGVQAVERIETLQRELSQVKALNLALTQDLESTRRTAERATEEARIRMDEARRLVTEMDGRAKLLSDLERELAALEGERDDAVLAVQEARQSLEAAARERTELCAELEKREALVAESVAEEERLAQELETSREENRTQERALAAVSQERDTLARQVADLTRERAELLEARKALEAVHRALAHAASR